MIELRHRYAHELRAGMRVNVSEEHGVYVLRKIVEVRASRDLLDIVLSDSTIITSKNSSWYVEE